MGREGEGMGREGEGRERKRKQRGEGGGAEEKGQENERRREIRTNRGLWEQNREAVEGRCAEVHGCVCVCAEQTALCCH